MDTLITLLTAMGPQHWLILGLGLLILEMVTGTTYLLWPAVAAFITALIAYLGLTNWIGDIAIFAVLVIVLTYFGQPIVKRWRSEGAASKLNDRAAQLVGARAVVMVFANGAGSVKIGDTLWRATSDEVLEAGAEVVVLSADGMILKVSRA